MFWTMSRVSGSMVIGPRGLSKTHALHRRDQFVAVGVAAGFFNAS